jgi:hypothetical protein
MVVAVGRFVLRGLQDLGRCHAMADWTVFTERLPADRNDRPEIEERTDVRYHGMGGFRT